MPAQTPEANKRYCRAYYRRTRLNPLKYSALLARHLAWKKAKKA